MWAFVPDGAGFSVPLRGFGHFNQNEAGLNGEDGVGGNTRPVWTLGDFSLTFNL